MAERPVSEQTSVGPVLVGPMYPRLVAAGAAHAAFELVRDHHLGHLPALRVHHLRLVARVVHERLLTGLVDLAHFASRMRSASVG